MRYQYVNGATWITWNGTSRGGTPVVHCGAYQGYPGSCASARVRTWHRGRRCISCGHWTESDVCGVIGGATGPMCADCQYWCDGNVIEARELATLAACSDFRCPACLAVIARYGTPVPVT